MRPSFPSATREDDSVESKRSGGGAGKRKLPLFLAEGDARRGDALRTYGRFAYIRRSNITVDTREAPGSGG